MSDRRTPLHEVHEERGAKFTDFGGWQMPVEFASISEEHAAVRDSLGVFDVSHMGEIEVSGPDATRLMNRLTTNDVTALDPGDSPVRRDHERGRRHARRHGRLPTPGRDRGGRRRRRARTRPRPRRRRRATPRTSSCPTPATTSRCTTGGSTTGTARGSTPRSRTRPTTGPCSRCRGRTRPTPSMTRPRLTESSTSRSSRRRSPPSTRSTAGSPGPATPARTVSR